jgi:outer membrane autotransporter protein
MRLKDTTFAAMSLLALSSAATADNLSGINVGGSVVLGESLTAEATENKKGDNPGDSDSIGATDNFGSADLKIGYNAVLSNGMFLGAEANYNLTGIDENVIDEPSKPNKVDVSKEGASGLRGKLGAALNDDIALYGIVGYQSTEFEVTAADEDSSTSEKNDHTGVSYGIGMTYAVQSNLLVTAEAIQTNYDDKTYFDESDIEPDETQFGVGLAYRFDI